MSETPRYFTLEQANAMIKMIRPMMAEILEIRRRILALQPEVWPVVEKAVGNGGSEAASRATREFERLNRLVLEIQATGAVIKDVNNGLVDFLTLRDGKDVFLCWKYGEDQIAYWHDLDSGFNGRQAW